MQKEELERIRDYFIGKVVTVITPTINWNFDEKQTMDYFVGRVDHVSENGIWVTHPTTLCKNFYFMNQITGIVEEQVVYKDDPQYNEIVEEYKKSQNKKKEEKEAMQQSMQQQKPFVDIETLNRLAKENK